MNRRQLTRQVAYLLGKATWSDPPKSLVFQSVAVAEDAPENFIPETKTPFAVVSSLGSRGDPEHAGLRDREARIRVTIVASGNDRHGTAAILGLGRTGLGQSEGAGVLELEEAVRAALGRLGPENGILAAAGAETTSQVMTVQGVEVEATRFELLAWNVPAAPFYAPPSRLVAKGAAGGATLSWDLPPDRFDRVGVVIRRSDTGGPAPSKPTDGQPVPVAPLATTVTVSSLAPGTYVFAVFGAFDELANPPTYANRFSVPFFATAVVS